MCVCVYAPKRCCCWSFVLDSFWSQSSAQQNDDECNVEYIYIVDMNFQPNTPIQWNCIRTRRKKNTEKAKKNTKRTTELWSYKIGFGWNEEWK